MQPNETWMWTGPLPVPYDDVTVETAGETAAWDEEPLPAWYLPLLGESGEIARWTSPAPRAAEPIRHAAA